MARRPDDTRGSLIFQEGKCIEGEFYIVAVYDDPASCTISFSAYELENDCTYTYPLTYSEFDALFKFDSELMNPSNQDGRFHWVIERLDFVQDNRGQKVLCLAQEPTPEVEDDEDLVDTKPAATGVAPAYTGGGIDAATRAKLLKELDTQDDDKLHLALVKSEAARKRFLSDLHSKRKLEQLKASQRLQKADEEREERLQKLELIKKMQAQKALEAKIKEEQRKGTMQQLEVLMKQKEAQAIRRLIQEKDEQDRGAGREKDAARQKRKMQERSAKEVAEIERQRSEQLARKRDDQVQKRDHMVVKRNRAIAHQVAEVKEAERLVQVRRREEKDRIIEERWALKRAARNEKDRRRAEFFRLEDIRDRVIREKAKKRALEERTYWLQQRTKEQEAKEEAELRRAKTHKDFLLKWKVDAAQRAVTVREHDKNNLKRTKSYEAKQESRLRRFRESQFLDSVKSRSMTLSPKAEQSAEVTLKEPASPLSPGRQAQMQEELRKTFEQEQRQQRHAEREALRKQEEAKREKVNQLGSKDPSVAEILKATTWAKEDSMKKKAFEEARLAREVEQEKREQELRTRIIKREEKWAILEKVRDEKFTEKDRIRNEQCIAHTKSIACGLGIPAVFVY
mmetsp:Transcript_115099/g.245929  ORF Transcript_115099/g.245929 Transcript_115099/m.245929 type:complete len:625 (-) Transcript_115099:72-1946(-)